MIYVIYLFQLLKVVVDKKHLHSVGRLVGTPCKTKCSPVIYSTLMKVIMFNFSVMIQLYYHFVSLCCCLFAHSISMMMG